MRAPRPTGVRDYLLRKPNGDPLLLIEAKREEHFFELPATFSPETSARYIPVSTLLTDSNIAAAIEQVIAYCIGEGCEFAAITNGHAWIFFRVFERGKSWRSLRAFVIPSLDYFSDRFSEATNKLGYRSIIDRASLSNTLLPSASPTRTLYLPKDHIHAYDLTVTQNRFAPNASAARRTLFRRHTGRRSRFHVVLLCK